MPFDLTDAPSCFQTITYLFSNRVNSAEMKAYLDDMTLESSTFLTKLFTLFRHVLSNSILRGASCSQEDQSPWPRPKERRYSSHGQDSQEDSRKLATREQGSHEVFRGTSWILSQVHSGIPTESECFADPSEQARILEMGTRTRGIKGSLVEENGSCILPVKNALC